MYFLEVLIGISIGVITLEVFIVLVGHKCRLFGKMLLKFWSIFFKD